MTDRAETRKTLTVNLTPDEIAILERLVNPEAAAQRARNAELSKAIDHWRHEVGKLHSQIDTLKVRLDEQGRTADARKVVIEQREARITALEAENAKLRMALAQASYRMRNARGAVESNQVADKDVHGTLTRGMFEIAEALGE